jgi:hypothetical protein
LSAGHDLLRLRVGIRQKFLFQFIFLIHF